MNTQMEAEKREENIPGFDAGAFEQLVLTDAEASIAARQKAFERYLGLPAPRAVDEEWRRTSPQMFPFDKVQLLPVIPAGKYVAGPNDSLFDIVVSVSADGFGVQDASGLLADGKVKVMGLSEAAEQEPGLMAQYLDGKAIGEEAGKFEALNSAFWNFGLLVRIEPNVVLERGILVRCDVESEAGAFVPRLVLSSGAQSSATVVECTGNSPDSAVICVSTKEMYVEDGAVLKVISLQELNDQSAHLANDWARVERNATIEWIGLNFGSRLVKARIACDVAGEGSAAELDGLFFTHGEQHVDQKTLQIHSSPNTYSRLLYKGAVNDESHSVYQGIIVAKPGAVKVDAYQTNNNLVLSDSARADTIPGLLIDADDLKCSHGATIGNLDEDQLFYLRSRGISQDEARKVVINGFYDEVAQRIPYEFIRDRVHAYVQERG
ncbi:MAG: Fe-S cluster assembly protein SufD [Verrucomicrobia bacterium]|nr:Fe-S cluster assembly protein SufD [Verrucomicrobiota bacterium]